jgi:hypothetical protein
MNYYRKKKKRLIVLGNYQRIFSLELAPNKLLSKEAKRKTDRKYELYEKRENIAKRREGREPNIKHSN